MIKVVLEGGELTFGYGVMANIAASGRMCWSTPNRAMEVPVADHI
jgi:hypothetical protein